MLSIGVPSTTASKTAPLLTDSYFSLPESPERSMPVSGQSAEDFGHRQRALACVGRVRGWPAGRTRILLNSQATPHFHPKSRQQPRAP